jgi:hypothetical protein
VDRLDTPRRHLIRHVVEGGLATCGQDGCGRCIVRMVKTLGDSAPEVVGLILVAERFERAVCGVIAVCTPTPVLLSVTTAIH